MFSQSVTKKLNAVTHSGRHIVRKLEPTEAAEIISVKSIDLEWDERNSDWFLHNSSQVVLRRRPCGQHVIYSI